MTRGKVPLIGIGSVFLFFRPDFNCEVRSMNSPLHTVSALLVSASEAQTKRIGALLTRARIVPFEHADSARQALDLLDAGGIDGVLMSKMDGDARGGAALSVKAVTGKPIYFQGTGEKLDALEPFYPARMSSRILGMGDVLSLIERAQDAADEKAAEETAKRLMENKFDMNDMLEQFAQIRKMGGAGAMLSMLPGASGIDASQIDEKAFDRIEAMIYSMTKEEREKPSIINPKRKRRIAAGSGTRVEDVNKLLKQYEMMQKMMKQFKKSPKGFARRLGGMMGNPGAFRGLK